MACAAQREVLRRAEFVGSYVPPFTPDQCEKPCLVAEHNIGGRLDLDDGSAPKSSGIGDADGHDDVGVERERRHGQGQHADQCNNRSHLLSMGERCQLGAL